MRLYTPRMNMDHMAIGGVIVFKLHTHTQTQLHTLRLECSNQMWLYLWVYLLMPLNVIVALCQWSSVCVWKGLLYLPCFQHPLCVHSVEWWVCGTSTHGMLKVHSFPTCPLLVLHPIYINMYSNTGSSSSTNSAWTSLLYTVLYYNTI